MGREEVEVGVLGLRTVKGLEREVARVNWKEDEVGIGGGVEEVVVVGWVEEVVEVGGLVEA